MCFLSYKLSSWYVIKRFRVVLILFFPPFLIPAAQEDDCGSEISGEGGQDRHEDDGVLLQSQGQSRKEMNVVELLVLYYETFVIKEMYLTCDLRYVWWLE